ncbi:MAG: F0F1 ATP synthase subunit A [Verrucomicrobia bacterium]|nr:F0F1 ATP synthase subunit A [Verrucomicrobiota bacterium]
MISPLLANVNSAARPLFENVSFLSFLTDSCLVAAIVLGLIMWMARKATTNMQLVPHPAQNFFELVIEFFYDRIEGIVGPKVAPRAFPLLTTLFIFILISNWFGLLPGVGTIGWGEGNGFGVLHEVEKPLFRPATADLNLTLGLALIVFAFWIYITVKEVGVWGFFKHTFGPKGGLKGIMGLVMIVIFFFVGVIEVVSILLRNLTLPMRLYGNVYAGESVLHTMSSMLDGTGPVVSFIGSVLLPLPFYFMELLVGILQAMVFTLLTAVYIKLSTTHDDEHAEAHH